MAKNLFEQLLSKAGEIWSGPKTYGDYDIYINEDSKDSSGLSGVAKYLAKQEQAAKPKEEPVAAPVSGVEKYLARQQGSLPKAAQEIPTTGVGKYLARKASAGSAPPQELEPVITPKTGVGKYLAGQASAGSAPPKEPVVIPKTGVGKYLAGIPIPRATPAAPAPEKIQSQQTKPETKKTSAPAKKTAPAKEAAPSTVSKTSVPAIETASAALAHDVIHFENVTQCQSRTVKGTQCKNTNHLTKLQRTINKQKYQFSACPQHHNDTFKPYPPLLETH